jgi:uncharacterized protein YkwD
MILRLSSILFCILLFLISTNQTAFAQQVSPDSSFFALIKNYLIALTAIENYNKPVLGAQTQIAILPTNTPSPTPLTNDISTYLLNAVNQYRSSLGLSSVQSNAETCSFATLRASEITSNFSHNGFYNRVNNHTIPYAQWAHATENIAETSDYKQVVTLWENSPSHAANMRDNTPYVCIEQNGNYFAYEGMRP